jgi:neprosin-like protein
MRKHILAASAALIMAISSFAVASPAQASVPIAKPNAVPVPPSPESLVKNADAKPKKLTSSKKKSDAPKGFPRKNATRALTPCSPTCYAYSGSAGQHFTDKATGFETALSISKPFLAQASNNAYQIDYHTLGELAAEDGGNIAETGWQVSFNNYSDLDPHMFVYHWVNGAGQGYNTNFTDYSGTAGFSPVGPGDSLASYVGTTKEFGLYYFDNTGCSGCAGWWAEFDNLWVGFFPDANWTGAGQTFVDMLDNQIFGEVARANQESCTDMGSGAMAGGSASGVMNAYTLTGTTDTADFGYNLTHGLGPTNSARWSTVAVGTPVTTIRWGGPGYDSVGEGLGVKDACAPTAQGTPGGAGFQLWKEACPDNQTSTGCNSAAYFALATSTVGTCVAIPGAGTTIVNAAWNNSLSSGKVFQLHRTAACSGTGMNFGNGVKSVLPTGWDGTNVRAIKRTA